MRDLYSKTNAPYLIAGAFATLALLASGTLAVAPYVAFLSPITAFNVALPVALSLSILSILVLALSCKIISNNENKDLRDKNIELEAKVKGQLEHKEEKLSLEYQELRDENERVDSLIEELSQPQKEIDSLKRQLDELKNEEFHKEIEKLSKEKDELYKEIERLYKKKKNYLKDKKNFMQN